MAQDPQDVIDAKEARDAAATSRAKKVAEATPAIPVEPPTAADIESIRMQNIKDAIPSISEPAPIIATGASDEEKKRLAMSNKFNNAIIDNTGQVVYVDDSGKLPDGSTPIQARNADGSFLTPGVAINVGAGTTGATGTIGGATKFSPNADQVDAIQNLTSTFLSYGLSADIASSIADLVAKGYKSSTISMIAQDPTSKEPLALAYQKRFAGNAERIKQGLAPLSPSEYMSVENSYAQILRQAGVPKGFYDNQQSYADWIGKGVAPTEVQSRVNLAKDVLANADPFYMQQMQNLYGLDQGHALAHILDPGVAIPLLEKQVNAVTYGAEAKRAGIDINQSFAEGLYGAGITQGQARAGFTNVAQNLQPTQNLAAIYGQQQPGVSGVNAQQQLEAAQFNVGVGGFTAAQAKQNLRKLSQQELNQFGGSAGVDKSTLSDQSVIGSI